MEEVKNKYEFEDGKVYVGFKCLKQENIKDIIAPIYVS